MHWIDPDYLPEIAGTVDQFLVNKHGEADGFLLTDGGEVHVPPHLSSRMLRDLRHGPKGEMRGAVLEDGRIIRLPPHEGQTLF